MFHLCFNVSLILQALSQTLIKWSAFDNVHKNFFNFIIFSVIRVAGQVFNFRHCKKVFKFTSHCCHQKLKAKRQKQMLNKLTK
jgi:hypothetical protein